MINVIKGLSFLISGVLIFGFTYITAAQFAQTLDEWSGEYGVFGTAFREIHGFQLSFASIIFIVIGIIHLYKKDK
ncbi:hypothetical protein ACIQ6U_13220 [Lysinibacillus fusiformis]|uniref:hypothetical protein n=1 Tax=Lysinibacillus TaxID=400634 RepID=UPI000691B18A